MVTFESPKCGRIAKQKMCTVLSEVTVNTLSHTTYGKCSYIPIFFQTNKCYMYSLKLKELYGNDQFDVCPSPTTSDTNGCLESTSDM